MPVASLITVIVAPGITAPEVSITEPVIAPFPESCAIAPKGAIMAMVRRTNHPHPKPRRNARRGSVDALHIPNCVSITNCLIKASKDLLFCCGSRFVNPRLLDSSSIVVGPLCKPYQFPAQGVVLSIGKMPAFAHWNKLFIMNNITNRVLISLQWQV